MAKSIHIYTRKIN